MLCRVSFVVTAVGVCTQTAVMCNSPHVLQKAVWQAVDNIEQQAEGVLYNTGEACA